MALGGATQLQELTWEFLAIRIVMLVIIFTMIPIVIAIKFNIIPQRSWLVFRGFICERSEVLTNRQLPQA